MNNLVQTILGPANDSASTARQLYRVHRKNGQPFALFPSDASLQSQLASLLPAQSWKARLYRQIVRLSGLVGVGFPRETDEVVFPKGSALVALIQKISQSTAAPILLPGNPNGIAPRLILICLNDHNSPVGVIKAGQSEAARKLIRDEYNILKGIPSKFPQSLAPRAFDLVETTGVSSFGMEFVPGDSPKGPNSEPRLESFLSSCLDLTRTASIDETPLWSQLVNAVSEAGGQFLPSALQAFSKLQIHPCLYHGDFAPWNLREATDGLWTAIDWERGGLEGLPGWDWLHFSLQPAILVKRWPSDRILAHAQTTIRSPAFQRYLSKAIVGPRPSNVPELLLRSYFLYVRFVFMPPNCESNYRKSYEALATWATHQK